MLGLLDKGITPQLLRERGVTMLEITRSKTDARSGMKPVRVPPSVYKDMIEELGEIEVRGTNVSIAKPMGQRR